MNTRFVTAIATVLAIGSGIAVAAPAMAQGYPPPQPGYYPPPGGYPPPPPPPREAPPPPPPRGRPMAWEPGHYQWLPGQRRYVWVDGHYIDRRPGGEFIPGHWDRRGDWIPPHWR